MAVIKLSISVWMSFDDFLQHIFLRDLALNFAAIVLKKCSVIARVLLNVAKRWLKHRSTSSKFTCTITSSRHFNGFSIWDRMRATIQSGSGKLLITVRPPRKTGLANASGLFWAEIIYGKRTTFINSLNNDWCENKWGTWVTVATNRTTTRSIFILSKKSIHFR